MFASYIFVFSCRSNKAVTNTFTPPMFQQPTQCSEQDKTANVVRETFSPSVAYAIVQECKGCDTEPTNQPIPNKSSTHSTKFENKSSSTVHQQKPYAPTTIDVMPCVFSTPFHHPQTTFQTTYSPTNPTQPNHQPNQASKVVFW